MGKQHNRRIFAGFYKRYDNKYIYVVAVVPDVDTGGQVVIFHEGIDACECKYTYRRTACKSQQIFFCCAVFP